jgi:hypothetical protein
MRATGMRLPKARWHGAFPTGHANVTATNLVPVARNGGLQQGRADVLRLMQVPFLQEWFWMTRW